MENISFCGLSGPCRLAGLFSYVGGDKGLPEFLINISIKHFALDMRECHQANSPCDVNATVTSLKARNSSNIVAPIVSKSLITDAI